MLRVQSVDLVYALFEGQIWKWLVSDCYLWNSLTRKQDAKRIRGRDWKAHCNQEGYSKPSLILIMAMFYSFFYISRSAIFLSQMFTRPKKSRCFVAVFYNIEKRVFLCALLPESWLKVTLFGFYTQNLPFSLESPFFWRRKLPFFGKRVTFFSVRLFLSKICISLWKIVSLCTKDLPLWL